jgi:hypothetical protein
MTRLASSRRWTRAVAAAGLVLALRGASPAHADGPSPPAQTSDRRLPLPPPGTHRLIRIGPQMLVSEDDQGRVTMVDEPTDQPRRGRSLAGVAAVLGVFSGSLLLFEVQTGAIDIGAPRERLSFAPAIGAGAYVPSVGAYVPAIRAGALVP